MSTPLVDPTSAASNRSTVSAGRKLASWTTNLLASGLVLIVGLVAGREVLLWWRSPPGESTSPSLAAIDNGPPAWDFDRGFFDLRFGAAPVVVRRQVFSGDRPAVQETLRRHSAALAQQALAQESSRRQSQAQDPADATRQADPESTRRLLKRLAGMTPVSGEPDRWALYEWPTPLPANVVVNDPPSRILAWGLAFPDAKPEGENGNWSLFSWADLGSPERSSPSNVAGAEEPPRPEGTTLGLCITSPDDTALATFQARGGTAWIERHYDEWSRRVGGQVESAWRSTGRLRSARYRLPAGSSVLVQLDGQDPAAVRGIVTQWPRRAQ